MREFVAGNSEAGQRLDKFLKKLLPGAPLSLIYKLSRTNRAKVDGKKRENDYRIEEGQSVKVFLSEEEFAEFGRDSTERYGLGSTNHTAHGPASSSPDDGAQTSASDVKRKFILSPDRIAYEDEFLLAVKKPAGVNVHPGDHKSDEASLIEAVSDYYAGSLDTLTFRPALVHRIDRDTSGLVLIAKTKRSLDRLLSDLQSGKIDKTYAAVTVGVPNPKKGTIRDRLLRIENAKGTDKVKIDPSGQNAVTHYDVANVSKDGKYALLECRIETGRTHQIRVHLASLGTPVLGDKTYGHAGENAFAKRTLDIRRQQLHAWKLKLPHPDTGKKFEIECPFEADMAGLFPNS